MSGAEEMWPPNALVVESIEELEEVLRAPKVVLFLSVPWSMPERHARVSFMQLMARWEHTSDVPIRFAIVDEDNDQLRTRLLGDSASCALGAGSMIWLAAGTIVRMETAPDQVPMDRLLSMTQELADE